MIHKTSLSERKFGNSAGACRGFSPGSVLSLSREHRLSTTRRPATNSTTTTHIGSLFKMSAPEVNQKTFGKSTRDVPKEKAQKYYPAEDESKPKKVNIYLQILL